MSNEKSPYEMSNEELLLAFQMASADLGRTNSYWGPNSSAGDYAREKVRDLLRALHARLDGQKPPFTKGARVHDKKWKRWTLTVESVYYSVVEKRWLMNFTYESCTNNGPLPCDGYELAPAVETCAVA